jgi:hypothetical protein
LEEGATVHVVEVRFREVERSLERLREVEFTSRRLGG